MGNCIKCGVFDMGNGVMPVVCVKSTGDLVVIDDLCGPVYISEITVEDPIAFVAKDDILDKLNCKGVVICGSGRYVFNEDNYQFSEITDLGNVKLESDYDLETEYEGPELDWMSE